MSFSGSGERLFMDLFAGQPEEVRALVEVYRANMNDLYFGQLVGDLRYDTSTGFPPAEWSADFETWRQNNPDAHPDTFFMQRAGVDPKTVSRGISPIGEREK